MEYNFNRIEFKFIKNKNKKSKKIKLIDKKFIICKNKINSLKKFWNKKKNIFFPKIFRVLKYKNKKLIEFIDFSKKYGKLNLEYNKPKEKKNFDFQNHSKKQQQI